MVFSAHSQALGRLDKDSFPGQAFSRLLFRPPHSLRDCLHLTPVVCLGRGAVATGAYCLLPERTCSALSQPGESALGRLWGSHSTSS